jgi:hypothetical protein
MWVDNFDALFEIFSVHRKDSNREIKRDQDSIITPNFIQTLCLPTSRLSYIRDSPPVVFSLAHRDSLSISLLFT